MNEKKCGTTQYDGSAPAGAGRGTLPTGTLPETGAVRGTLLQIDGLVVSFRDAESGITAVRGVDLTIDKGENLALVGESGCGKTVMCKSMLGLLCRKGVIDEGRIIYFAGTDPETPVSDGGKKPAARSDADGTDLAVLSERELVRFRGGEIAMIPQDPMTSLDPVVAVGEQIAEAARLAGAARAEARARALELMELVGISDAPTRYDQRPYQFSGGMRQRIVIAIALAGRPRLLLADEPTTALDAETQEGILRLIRDVQKQTGVSVLFITHDLSLVEEMAQRVAIMKEGRLVEEGPVNRVFSDPQHPYTRQLLGYLDYQYHRGHNHRGKGSDGQTAGSRAEELRPEGRWSSDDLAAGGRPENALEETRLCVEHLFKTYGTRYVLHDFSMNIHRGEIVGIIGRSGCGKSTLARCIMGIEPYDGGIIRMPAGRDRTQMIFQESQDAFNERMTIHQIIAEPLMIRRAELRAGKAEIRRRVDTAMAEVGLDTELAGRHPYELSGGQRQRAAVARALIADPAVIIADEPLTGLDVTAQAKIVHLFRELVDKHDLSLMLIAHDRPMVEHVSDRIIEMEGWS